MISMEALMALGLGVVTATGVYEGGFTMTSAAYESSKGAVAVLTKIFLDEIERLLCAAAGGASDPATPASARPRLGGISFLASSAESVG